MFVSAIGLIWSVASLPSEVLAPTRRWPRAYLCTDGNDITRYVDQFAAFFCFNLLYILPFSLVFAIHWAWNMYSIQLQAVMSTTR